MEDFFAKDFFFWLLIQCKVFSLEKTSKDNEDLCFFDKPCGFIIIHTSLGIFIMSNSSVHIVFIIYLVLILFCFEMRVYCWRCCFVVEVWLDVGLGLRVAAVIVFSWAFLCKCLSPLKRYSLLNFFFWWVESYRTKDKTAN